MKMPEKVRISVDLIKLLRCSDRRHPQRVADIAPKVQTTEAFLAQIVNILGREGLLEVTRGPGGGITSCVGYTNLLEICQVLGYLTEEPGIEGGIELCAESRAVEIKLRSFLEGVIV